MITLEEKRKSEKKAAMQIGYEKGLEKGLEKGRAEVEAKVKARDERRKIIAAALLSAGRSDEFIKALSDEKRLNELASELGID